MLQMLDTKLFGTLATHLNDVADSVKLLTDIVDDDFLSKREKQLLIEVVAPTHDLFKLLGGKEGQKMSDHEEIAAYVLKKYLPKMGYSNPDEVAFVVGVVGDHENIFKEEGRRGFMASDSHIERAKAIFFLADTLTGVVEVEDGKMTVDQKQLEKRFGDLYFRHMDLEVGKVFRPEWGVFAVGDYAEFLKVLAERGGLTGERGVITKIIESALRAIDRANKGNKFSGEQQKAVDEAAEELRELVENFK